MLIMKVPTLLRPIRAQFIAISDQIRALIGRNNRNRWTILMNIKYPDNIICISYVYTLRADFTFLALRLRCLNEISTMDLLRKMS